MSTGFHVGFPFDHSKQWCRLQGLMFGVALLHIVQPISAWAGSIEWIPKHWVALAGGVLYGVSFFSSLWKQKWGLYINIIGPMVGLSTIMGAFLLNQLGVLESSIRPDAFQIVGGLPQVWALLISVGILRKW